jgi:hypothetical protein
VKCDLFGNDRSLIFVGQLRNQRSCAGVHGKVQIQSTDHSTHLITMSKLVQRTSHPKLGDVGRASEREDTEAFPRVYAHRKPISNICCRSQLHPIICINFDRNGSNNRI